MKWAFAIPFLAVLGAWLYSGYTTFEVGKKVQPTNSNCKAVRGAQGVEDLVVWKDNVLAGNLASTELWLWPGKNDPSFTDPASVKSGSIYHVRNLETDPVLEKVKITGFPEGVALHAHGLGLFEDYLFAINHAYTKGGERVEKFKISQEESSGKISLTYVSSVTFPEDHMGIINDIAAFSQDEFYVSTWLPWADSLRGRSLSPISKIINILYLINPFGVKWTWLIHCRGSSGKSESLCHETGPKAEMWNGMTTDGKKIYAYSLTKNTVFAFDRTKDGELVNPKPISLAPHFGDNIEYNPKDGQLWTGGMATLFDCYILWVGDYEHSIGVLPKGGPSPSGAKCPIHSSSVDPKTGKVTNHVLHDGSLLGGASASVKVGNKIVIGTWIDDGVLVCDA